jgi:molecular chaperone GrpE
MSKNHKQHPHPEAAATDATVPTAPGANGDAVASAPTTPAPEKTTPPATPATSPVETELAALKEKHLRLMADFDNFRKRQSRDREDDKRRATENLLQELLPVLDHLELALACPAPKDDPFVRGVQMVADQLLATLARFDLAPFDATGKPFDPQRHEALMEQPSANVPAQHVVQQTRRGYMLGGRILRPSQVIISSGPAAAAAHETASANP